MTASAAVGTLLALLSVSCGRPGASEPTRGALTLEPRTTSAELSAARAVQVVARKSVADFEFEPSTGRIREGRWHPAGADPARVRMAGPFDLATLDRVAFDLVGEGQARWQAAFLAGGQPLAVLPLQDAVRAEEALLVDVPAEERGVADELVLSFAAGGPELGLAEVALLRRPPSARVPAPDEGVQRVTRDRTSRPVVGLFPGVPVRTNAVFGAGDSLCFAFAGVDGQSVRVGVEGRSLGGSFETEFDSDPERSWTLAALQLPLEGEVELEFGLRTGAACALSVPQLGSRLQDAPTVLLITSDTHRGDHLGHAELGVAVETPALDALAQRGVSFLDARSVTNITNPSHVTLLTGVHPLEHGIVDNTTPLAGRAETLAEVFAGAGWATLAVTSASHLSPERSGLGQGFEVFAAPGVGEAESFDAVARLEALLPEFAGRPIFVWLHVFDAHAPYRPPSHWLERYVDTEADPRSKALPEAPRRIPWAPDIRDLGYLVDLYRAEVSGVDERLARVLELERFAGAWIAFTGDHGEQLGVDDGIFDHLTLEPANLHVPLVLAGPGVEPGVRSRAAVTNQDLGRTLLDLAGLWRGEFPGRNLLEVEASAEAARFAYARHGQSASVERDGWLFVRHLVDQTANGAPIDFQEGQEQLFDLQADRDCTRDLIGERPERAASLRSLLDDFLAGANPRGWGSERSASAAELAELEALGYAGGDDD